MSMTSKVRQGKSDLVRKGKISRDLGNGVTEYSCLCPSCGEDFFIRHSNGFTLLPCPDCGWMVSKESRWEIW